VVSPDEKKLYSIRTMPQDLAHALTDPRGFFSNRMNPVTVRAAFEALTGRDSQGKVVTAQKELLDLLRNVLPIPSQPILPGLRREGEGAAEGVARGLGIGVEDNRSVADRLAGQLASNRSESGPIDSEHLARHQRMIQREDDLRTGRATSNDLHDDYDKGLITKKDEDAIRKNVMETREMDAATARLYTRSSRLPMKDFLQVWDVATPPERAALQKLLNKKRQAYYKNADANMAPVARQQDRVYQRLRGMQRGGNGQPISVPTTF
jgi:hypothetical protein